MIGNITNRFFTRDNKRPLVWVIAIVIILVLIVMLICHSCGNDNNEGDAPNQLPEVVVNGTGDGHTDNRPQGIQIDTTTGLIFMSGTELQEIPLTNPATNNCAMIITIYLSDGSKLYQSDYIYPGDEIGQITINRYLERGTYQNALLVFSCYEQEDPHKPITQSEFQIEIKCL